MAVMTIDGVSFQMGESFDFSFLREWGKVFQVFDDQDSGNICFGTEKAGERVFLKFAGAPTARYEGAPADAVDRLKAAVPIYRDLKHPALIELLEEREIAGGYLAVFRWTDGVCMGKQYPAAREKFLTLPMEKRERVFRDILDFHIQAAERGYVAVDFYDGSILYDFAREKTILCDIDFYQKRPFYNKMGRLWGSSRFMSPEEFTLNAEIDEISNVFLMGAVAFALFGGELDRSADQWKLCENRRQVALKAVSERREDRFGSLRALEKAWREASPDGRNDENGIL